MLHGCSCAVVTAIKFTPFVRHYAFPETGEYLQLLLLLLLLLLLFRTVRPVPLMGSVATVVVVVV